MDVEDAEEEVSNTRAGPGGSRAEALQKQRDIQLRKRQASLSGGGFVVISGRNHVFYVEFIF
jgi:hypothetical protein